MGSADLPREPPREASRLDDGSYVLQLQDGTSVRWTRRKDGTWRPPERKRAGWVGELEQEKYVPRGAREAEARQQRMLAEAGGRSTVGQVIRVPGLAPEAQAKASSRNERRKEQRREKADAKEVARVQNAPSIDDGAPEDASTPSGQRTEKAVEKKLRQIAELEERVAQGAALSDAQAAKLASKDSWVAELARLRLDTQTPSTAPDGTPASSSQASPPRADGAAPAAAKPLADEAAAPPAEAAPKAVNRRAIEKKLRQIADLEDKKRQGQALSQEQLVKLAGKADLEALLQTCE